MNFEKLARIKEVLVVTFQDGKVKQVQWLKAGDLKNKFKK